MCLQLCGSELESGPHALPHTHMTASARVAVTPEISKHTHTHTLKNKLKLTTCTQDSTENYDLHVYHFAVRNLNLATSVGIVVYEAIRQLGVELQGRPEDKPAGMGVVE